MCPTSRLAIAAGGGVLDGIGIYVYRTNRLFYVTEAICDLVEFSFDLGYLGFQMINSPL